MVGKELLLSPTSNPIVQDRESLVLQQTATANIQLDKKLEGRVDEVLLYLVAGTQIISCGFVKFVKRGSTKCGVLGSI